MSLQSFASSHHGPDEVPKATVAIYKGVSVNIRKVDKDHVPLSRDNLMELKAVKLEGHQNIWRIIWTEFKK